MGLVPLERLSFTHWEPALGVAPPWIFPKNPRGWASISGASSGQVSLVVSKSTKGASQLQLVGSRLSQFPRIVSKRTHFETSLFFKNPTKFYSFLKKHKIFQNLVSFKARLSLLYTWVACCKSI
jgi:hypothetical protein